MKLSKLRGNISKIHAHQNARFVGVLKDKIPEEKLKQSFLSKKINSYTTQIHKDLSKKIRTLNNKLKINTKDDEPMVTFFVSDSSRINITTEDSHKVFSVDSLPVQKVVAQISKEFTETVMPDSSFAHHLELVRANNTNFFLLTGEAVAFMQQDYNQLADPLEKLK
jgi:predicted ribosome-associated RNA-binding protein Tma20